MTIQTMYRSDHIVDTLFILDTHGIDFVRVVPGAGTTARGAHLRGLPRDANKKGGYLDALGNTYRSLGSNLR